jgi:hypothetical protein
VDAELVDRSNNSLCSCCYYSRRSTKQTAESTTRRDFDASPRLTRRSIFLLPKSEPVCSNSSTFVQTSRSRRSPGRLRLRASGISFRFAVRQYCVLVLLLYVTVKQKKLLCAFVSKDSKNFKSSCEKEIRWWIIATCTRRRAREAPRSTLDTHKQRTRVQLHQP